MARSSTYQKLSNSIADALTNNDVIAEHADVIDATVNARRAPLLIR